MFNQLALVRFRFRSHVKLSTFSGSLLASQWATKTYQTCRYSLLTQEKKSVSSVFYLDRPYVMYFFLNVRHLFLDLWHSVVFSIVVKQTINNPIWLANGMEEKTLRQRKRVCLNIYLWWVLYKVVWTCKFSVTNA